jgi:hypothetical protein
MPLYAVPENELRDHCKRSIEGLELWLRRLIDQKLSAAYGPNYLDATRPNGDRIVRNEIRDRLKEKAAKEPNRFARLIDAAFLEDAINIICNPELYKLHFSDALSAAFPNGHAEVRTLLMRLVPSRNALYHANPITVHDAYRILCYSQDVISALKEYYRSQNMQQQFNAPTVIRISDSLGHVVHLSSSNRHPNGPAMLDYSRDDKAYLRSGDTISIEVDVDPSFDPTSYEIHWLISDIGGGPNISGRKFTLLLTEKYVSTRFCAVCRVISNAGWHKLGTHDDQIDIAYRVLPPVE